MSVHLQNGDGVGERLAVRVGRNDIRLYNIVEKHYVKRVLRSLSCFVLWHIASNEVERMLDKAVVVHVGRILPTKDSVILLFRIQSRTYILS